MLFELMLATFLYPRMVALFPGGESFFNQAQFNEQKTNGIVRNVESPILDVVLTAEAALAVDAKTGTVLYAKNEKEIRSIASITKLMTAMVVLDHNPDFSQTVSLRASDRHNGGMIHLNIGEELSFRDLFYSALVGSDNDSAYAIARLTGLSSAEFIDRMNKKARELGMDDSVFVDPTGLNTRNQSTALDIVRLLEAAGEYPEIVKATGMPSHSFTATFKEREREVIVYNTDRLSRSNYLDLLVGKTGYLQEAGYCLAAKLKGQTGRDLYIVVLGSDTLVDRFQDIKAIEYYIANAYTFNDIQ